MDAMPIGTLWDSESYKDGMVTVIGYRRPESAELMTLPPFTPEELADIEVPEHLKESLAKHMRSTLYGR